MKPLAKALALALGLLAAMWWGNGEVVATQGQLESGDLLVTDITDFRDPHKGGRLVKIDRETGEVRTLLETPKPPNGMALERVGDVLHVFLALGGPVALGGQEHGDVVFLALDLREGQIRESRLLPVDVVNPTDIEIDPTNGDLIVADAAMMSVFGREGTPGDIFRVKRESGEPRVAGSQTANRQRTIVSAEDPQGVAIHGNSNILYSDTVGEVGSSYIRRIEPGAATTERTTKRMRTRTLAEIPQSTLSGVSIGPDGGSLWVTTATSSCVETNNGQVVSPIPGVGVEVLTEGLDSPRDIAIDPARPRIAFITSFLGEVIQLDLETGERATFAREGLNHPNYVQIIPDAADPASVTVADGTGTIDVAFASSTTSPIETTAVAAPVPDEKTSAETTIGGGGCASGPPLPTPPSALPTAWSVVVGAILALGAYLLWWR